MDIHGETTRFKTRLLHPHTLYLNTRPPPNKIQSQLTQAQPTNKQVDDGDAVAQFEVGCRYMIGEGAR